MKARVAVLKVKPESVLDDVAHVCDLAGLQGALPASQRTLLFPSLDSNRPFPASTTTPWQLEGAIRALGRAGLDGISCVRSERPPRALDRNALGPVLRSYGVAVLDTFDPDQVRWVEYRPRANLHVLHRAFPEGVYLPDQFFGTNVMHLPTARCNARAIAIGAMHGTLAALLGAKQRLAFAEIDRVLVDLLAIQREIHAGVFALMDATTVGNGAGGQMPVVKDYLLASADLVALDAIAAKMMGFDPLGIEFIRVAHEDGLGVGDPVDIELVGEDISNQSWGFSAESTKRGAPFGTFVPPSMRRLLAGNRLALLVAASGEVYREHVRWPRRDKLAFELWKAETTWGKLFTRYERGPLERLAQMPSLKR
jgi:uncharacterized protein (DUF362 family)